MNLSARWERIKTSLALGDLMLDVIGKFLVGLGFGALLAQWLASSAWLLIALGVGVSAVIKAKYWKLFWEG